MNEDLLLHRLTFSPGLQQLQPIPFPDGLAPKPALNVTATNQKMPSADVLVVTWTTAEAEALADVLTPGHHRTNWAKYLKDWPQILPHLTERSPARQAGCGAHFWLTQVGDVRVVVAKSELHLATDDDTAPVVGLWQSMISDIEPQLVISTGTAGGIGASTALGDVFVCTSGKFNCTKEFKSKPWAQQRFEAPSLQRRAGTEYLDVVEQQLIPVNADRLKPSGVAPRLPLVTVGGDVETVDYFAFADTDDSYGVVANDPQAHTEEMDDCTLPLALEQMGSNTPWVSIRNASDPQVPSSIGSLEQQKEWASKIYDKYGYWTTVGSALASWGVIADLS